MSGINFPLSDKGWQRGGGSNLFSTNVWDRATTRYDKTFRSASNSESNVTNARGVKQFVAVRQTIGDQKLWKSHYHQQLFRVIDPHDLDHTNFLLMREEQITKAFASLRDEGDGDMRDFYDEGPAHSSMGHGPYPYGRYQTLPQVNYSLAQAQLVCGTALTYSDVWERVRPSGICLTSESSQENADGVLGDVRTVNITGPEKTHNVFGKNIGIGWQFGVLIKPVPVNAGKSFTYRVTIDGEPLTLKGNTCLDKLDNKTLDQGYMWQMDFYCCPGKPPLDTYSASIMTGSVRQEKIYVTGGYIRLGRIHYEHMETSNFLEYRPDLFDDSTFATDMDLCATAPLIDVFWDPSSQKLH